MNIYAARNHKSGNLEIRILVLGYRLFYACPLIHFSEDIGQSLTASALRNSLYQYSQSKYDLVCTKTNPKSDFHITRQLMENYPE